MKRYRIGDFARQMGVSIDFIKYYEENGLITSFCDPTNHYHYYDFSQSHYIMQIQYLRSLGYSVKEITLLLNTADKRQAASLYGKKASEHLTAMRRSAYSADQLKTYQEALEHRGSGLWYIVQKPAIYFLPHTNDEEYIRTDRTAQLIQQWNNHAPFVHGLDRWFFRPEGTVETCFCHMQHGRAVEAVIAGELDLDTDDPVCYIKGTRCLEYYLNYTHDLSFDQSPSLTADKFREALEVIAQKNFRITGDMFVRFLTFFQEDGKQKELNVLYIPIE